MSLEGVTVSMSHRDIYFYNRRQERSMKKSICLIATALLSISSLYGQNLLTNGGFEQSSGNLGNGTFTTTGNSSTSCLRL